MKNRNSANILVALVLSVCFIACTKVDKTYLQPRENLAKFNGTVYDYIKAQPAGVYDSLLFVLNRVPDLIDSLKTQPVTFFSLTNKSFELAIYDLNFNAGIPQGTINLSNINASVLDTFLCRYIIRDKYLTTDLLRATDGYTLPSIKYSYLMNLQYSYTNASGYVNGGPRAIIFSDTRTSPFISLWVRTNAITVDVVADNGIVNVISPGHAFGFGSEFQTKVYDNF